MAAFLQPDRSPQSHHEERTNRKLTNFYHLRIVWSLGTDSHAINTDASEIVFVSVQLLPFYNAMPSAIPIKAVYRDVVVGIRYQHPLSSSHKA